PQTTCCTTTLGAPIVGTGPPPVVSPAPIAVPLPADMPPSISGTKTPGSGMSEPKMYDRYYPPIDKLTPGTSFQPKLGIPTPVLPQAPAAQPPVKLDRIAIGPDSHVEGQILRSDNSPKPSAKILFIEA